MGIAGGPNLNQDGLVFLYDVFDQDNSYKGEPTVNYVPGTYNYSLYAYVSGPVDTVILNEKNQSITAKRYTITNAVNTARARILPSGLATGVAYTFSFKWKYNGTTTASPSVGIDASKGNPEGGANNNSFTSQTTNTVFIGNGWYLSTYIFVFSSVPTGNCMLTFGIVTNTTAGYVGETFDIYEAQFEIKNHRTQYSNGTRSATQGLLDVAGANQIDISNASFNANAQITFDGTNDYINVPYNTSHNLTNQGTISVWINPASLTQGSYAGLVSQSTGGSANSQAYQLSWRQVSGGLFGSICNGSGTYNDVLASFPSIANAWYNIVFTWNGSLLSIYNNGILSAQSAQTIVNQVLTTDLTIGGYTYKGAGGVDEYFNGSINNVELFNRGFTAQEVLQNYNTKKSRFGLK